MYTGKKNEYNNDLFGSAKITLSKDSYVYDGKAKEPKVTVYFNKICKSYDPDSLYSYDATWSKINTNEYTVKYTNNKQVGTATVTIKFKSSSNYSGTIKETFKITKKEVKATGIKVAAQYGMSNLPYGVKIKFPEMTITPASTTNKKVTWTLKGTLNTANATISSDGKYITAKNAGQTAVIATTSNGVSISETFVFTGPYVNSVKEAYQYLLKAKKDVDGNDIEFNTKKKTYSWNSITEIFISTKIQDKFAKELGGAGDTTYKQDNAGHSYSDTYTGFLASKNKDADGNTVWGIMNNNGNALKTTSKEELIISEKEMKAYVKSH
jgi:hypothetical protein